MKTILPAGEPNYRAAHAAYRRVTAYWAPEWIDSPEHFAKLLDAMLAAAGETCDPAEASDSPNVSEVWRADAPVVLAPHVLVRRLRPRQ